MGSRGGGGGRIGRSRILARNALGGRVNIQSRINTLTNRADRLSADLRMENFKSSVRKLRQAQLKALDARIARLIRLRG